MLMFLVPARVRADVAIGSRWNRCDASQTVDTLPSSAVLAIARSASGVSLPSKESPKELGIRRP